MPFTERYLQVLPPIEVRGRQVKRYHLNVHDADIEPEIVEAAYAGLPAQLPEPDGTEPAAFVVLHRGVTGAYLNAYSWVWGNVIECACRVAGVPSIGSPDDDPTHFEPLRKPWIGCVWELAVLEHERGAWVAHLCGDEQSLSAYLADSMAGGLVGRGQVPLSH